jgi:Domain of unknown function (DUF4349)
MSASEMTVETLLRAHAPLAPQSLRTRVLASEPRRTPSRRLVLVLAVALVAAVAAAVVDGIVTSGPKHPRQQSALRALAPPARKTFAPAVGAGGATHGALPAATATRLQQYDATLSVRVKDPSSAATQATRVATSLGGYAQSVTYSSASRSASVVLRVPVANVKTALARLESLGTVVSQNLSVNDLQHDLQTETAEIAELRRTIATLEAALRNPSLQQGQRVLLQIRLANAKRSLSERRHAQSGTIAAGTNARISLDLETKAAAVPVPQHRGRLGRMTHSAVGFLGLEGTAVLYGLIVLSPLAVMVALLWSLREVRRRRDQRLVME